LDIFLLSLACDIHGSLSLISELSESCAFRDFKKSTIFGSSVEVEAARCFFERGGPGLTASIPGGWRIFCTIGCCGGGGGGGGGFAAGGGPCGFCCCCCCLCGGSMGKA
jgi:hypothetical protein